MIKKKKEGEKVPVGKGKGEIVSVRVGHVSHFRCGPGLEKEVVKTALGWLTAIRAVATLIQGGEIQGRADRGGVVGKRILLYGGCVERYKKQQIFIQRNAIGINGDNKPVNSKKLTAVEQQVLEQIEQNLS